MSERSEEITEPGAESAVDATTGSVALREPAHQVSPRAVTYWRIIAGMGTAVDWIIAIAIYVFALDERPWWTTAILVVVLVAPLAHLLVMPPWRYRIHRWEITPTAIHTRAGWLNIDSRVAPLSRVQTVDSTQNALMRPFKLASLTVTTASAAGPITIACLDQDVARRLVAELTEITGASEGDAT